MRFLVLIIVSIMLAAGVIFVMLGKGKPAPKIEDGHFVLATKIEIPAGTFVNVNDHLIWQDVPEGKFPPEESKNFLRKDATNLAELNGSVARSFIAAGEPITRTKIVTPKDGGFMSAVLFPGMRAVSVGVTLVSGNAGFIFPGDKVDILLTHKVKETTGDDSFATETFIENVRVLAIDQKTNNPDKQAFVPKTVTLEVTPKQAEQILVAEELGKISLVLRSMGAASVAKVGAIDAGEAKNEAIGDEIILDVPELGENAASATQIANKGYTRGNEISKIARPISAASAGTVTITRGKSTTKITIDSSGTVADETTTTPTEAAN